MNNRGDVPSILFSVVMVAAIGILIFFFSYIFYTMYTEFDDVLSDNPDYNNTEITSAISDIQSAEQSVWDYGFLGIAIGYVLLVMVFGFTQQTHPVFYWISVILGMLGLFIGTMMGRVWQGIAAEPALADTVARFPIMDALLGTYYPTFVTFLILLGLVSLYGKQTGAPGR